MSKKITSNAMLKVIEEGIPAIHESKNILARLWRIIIYKVCLNGQNWHTQLNKWQDKINRESTTKKLANVKGNITRALASPRMSWESLLRGLAILEFEKMDIQITLYKRGTNIVIPLSVDLTSLSEDDLEENADSID